MNKMESFVQKFSYKVHFRFYFEMRLIHFGCKRVVDG